MKWITRERPKIDRIAYPWLIARFIDPVPEFLYVPANDVVKVAAEIGATPYDIQVNQMKSMIIATSLICAASHALAAMESLDANVEGQAPTGWICGAVGKSPARWVK